MTIAEVLQKHDVSWPVFGVGCNDGWAQIIDSLFDQLGRIGWDGKVAQIKEKFGALRVYLDTCPEDEVLYRNTEAALQKAEDDSCKTCEICGMEGQLKNRHGYLQTLCQKCEALVLM